MTAITSAQDVFGDAIRKLDHAAEHIAIDPEALERLKHAKAILQVSVPVRMDDGSLRIFEGYRVRYDDTRGRPRAASATTHGSTSTRSTRSRCG